MGLDGTLQSGRLDQPRSSFNGAPIMIIHADDVGAHDADGADGGLVEDVSGEVAKSKLVMRQKIMIKMMIKKMRHQSYGKQPHLWLI